MYRSSDPAAGPEGGSLLPGTWPGVRALCRGSGACDNAARRTGGNRWRVVVWKYEGGSRPGLRRVWSSREPINGFPWVIDGRLSEKIQGRLKMIEQN